MNEKSIYDAASQIADAEERKAYLDKACGDDSRIRRWVEARLRRPRNDPPDAASTAPSVDQTMDLRDVEEDVPATHGSNEPIVRGSAGQSVLAPLENRLPQVPRVKLRDTSSDTSASNSPDDSPSKADGRYQLGNEIARGGMGAVLKGRDSDLGRDLAIKVLLEAHSDKPDVVARFIEEAQIGGQLQHPGIVPVYELGQFADERPFFSMKLVKGKTLATMLAARTNATDDQSRLLGIFEQVCHTMAYAHSRGVIHRDLKPANIMVGAFGEVQVMDWGLAKVLTAGEPADKAINRRQSEAVSVIRTLRSGSVDDTDGSHTYAGSILGTPAYMPPEQALGEIDRLDERADVFGLGAILCEILTGKPPYVGEDATHIFRKAVQAKLSDCIARLDDANIDSELTEIAKQCLAEDPDDRLIDAGNVAERMATYLLSVRERAQQAAIERADAEARAEEAIRRRRLHLAVAVLMLSIAIGSAAAAGLFWRERGVQASLAAENGRLAAENDLKRRAAEDQLAVSRVLRLASHSESVRQSYPIRSLLLALESVESSRGQDGSVTRVAHSTLMNAAASVGGWPLLDKSVDTVAASPDGNWLVAGTSSGDIHVWSMRAGRLPGDAKQLPAHTDRIHSVAISPDSRWLATASDDGTARIYDLAAGVTAASGRLVVRSEAPLLRAVFGPNNRWLALGSEDGPVYLGETTAPSLDVMTLPGHTMFVKSIAFSPEGRWLVTGSRDGTARRWDLNADNIAESSALMPGPDHPFGIFALGITPDSKTVIAGGSRRFAPGLRMWDLSTSNPASSLQILPEAGFVWAIATSRDGRWILSTAENRVRLWDQSATDLPGSLVTLNGHTGWIHALAVTSDNRVISAGLDKTIRIWDLSADDPEESAAVLRGHDQFVETIALSQDERWLASGGPDGVRLWNLSQHNPAFSSLVLRSHSDAVNSLALSDDGHCLATAGQDHAVCVWELADGPAASPPRVLRGHSAPVRAVALSANGRWLLSGSEDTRAGLWDLDDTDPAASARFLPGHQDSVGGVSFSADSRWAVTKSADGSVRMWDLRAEDPTADVIVVRHEQGGVWSARMTPDSRWLVSAGHDGTARVWDLSANDPASSAVILQHDGPITAVSISPDARWVVAGSRISSAHGNHRVLCWDLATKSHSSSPVSLSESVQSYTESPDGRWGVIRAGTEARLIDLWSADPASSIRVIKDVTVAIDAHCISNDGHWMASVSDRAVHLWDLSSEDPGSSTLVLTQHERRVSCLDITPDSRWLITGSDDNTVRIWELDLEALVERARGLAGRQLTPSERRNYMTGARL